MKRCLYAKRRQSQTDRGINLSSASEWLWVTVGESCMLPESPILSGQMEIITLVLLIQDELGQ